MLKPTVDIHPKKGINNIKIGSFLNSHLLTAQSRILHKTPIDPIVLQLIHQHTNLIFSSSRQKLIFVEVIISDTVDYKYNGISLNDKWDINSLYNDVFGPTYNGEVIDDYYILSYPGISFRFKGDSLNDLLKSGTKAQSFIIHPYKSYSELLNEANNLIVTEPVEIDKLQVNINKDKNEILVSFACHFKAFKDFQMQLHQSVQQDILAVLGPPDDTFTKDETKTSIHNENVIDSKEYVFHNYFRYGFDLLYHNNTLTKVVIHLNLPLNKLAFGKYNKCLFFYQGDAGFHVNQDHTYSEIKKVLGSVDPIIVNRSNNSQGIEIVNETDINMESLVYVHDDYGLIWDVIDDYVDNVTFY